MPESIEILQQMYPGAVFLSVSQAARPINLREQTLRNKLSNKTIPLKTIQNRGRRLIHIFELARYMDELAATENGPKNVDVHVMLFFQEVCYE